MVKFSNYSASPTIGGRSQHSDNNSKDLERRIRGLVKLYPKIESLITEAQEEFERHLTAIRHVNPKYFAKVCVGQILHLNKKEILADGTSTYLASPFFDSLNPIINSDKSRDLILALEAISKESPHDSHIKMIVAESYYKGIGVDKDQEKAVKIFENLATIHNYPPAQFRLGTLCRKKSEAIALWDQAAAQNNSAAQYELGLCHYHGIRDVIENKEAAVNLWIESAKQGNTHAQYELGLCYKAGIGIEQNSRMAAEQFSLAAENREFYGAQYELGLCYYNGNGVEKDSTFAIWLFAKAFSHRGKNDLKDLPAELTIDQFAQNTKLFDHEIVDVIFSKIAQVKPTLIASLVEFSLTASEDDPHILSDEGLRKIKKALETTLKEDCAKNPSYIYVTDILARKEKELRIPDTSASAASAIPLFTQELGQQI